MNALHELLNRHWIVRSRDKELYYKLKDASGEYRKFLSEKLGYQMIINPHIIKVVKMPGHAEPWMGIQKFESIMEYRMLCWILIFLEDKEPDGQFLLTQICEFMQMQAPKDEVDWTLRKHRKLLINVIHFCVEQGIFDVYDGNEEDFGRNRNTEALFGNLGTSKYFMRVFTQDIMTYESPKDFERSDWIDADETRGVVRRNRVYRRLALSMGMYRSEEEDADFDYIKNQRSLIEHDFQQFFDCHIDVHPSSAYLIVSADDNFGKSMPVKNMVCDILMLWNSLIRQEVEEGNLSLNSYEIIMMSKEELYASIEKIKNKYSNTFSKEYREMTTKVFNETIENALVNYGMIQKNKETERYELYPIIGKINGMMVERAEEMLCK